MKLWNAVLAGVREGTDTLGWRRPVVDLWAV